MTRWQYDKDGRPTHGDYCPNDDFACVCGFFAVMYDVMWAVEEGLRALGKGA